MTDRGRVMVYHASQAQLYVDALRQLGVQEAWAASHEKEAESLLTQVDVVFGWGFPWRILEQPNHVRWVQVMGAGVDDLMANGAAIPSGVTVTRLVDQFGPLMSEYVMTYLLAIWKGFERLRTQQRSHLWSPFEPGTLAGKTIGIAGIGSIGREIARKAKVFDMVVRGLSATGRNASAVDQHFGPLDWSAFVRDLDALVLTLPLTRQTRGIVTEDLLLQMKPGAILVNIGRGRLVDESGLLRVLHSGRLAAAVLDVFETEPLPKENPLWPLDNVFVTPHMSGLSLIPQTCEFFVGNLTRYLHGQPLLGVVDMDRQY